MIELTATLVTIAVAAQAVVVLVLSYRLIQLAIRRVRQIPG